MNWLTNTHLGRCALHFGAGWVGFVHGHPKLGFHIMGIARELRDILS